MEIMTAQQRLDHMKQAIDEGGVALYKGRTIGTIAGLPTLSDLATTTEERSTALSDIEARRKALDAEEARVRAASAGQPLGSADNVTTTGPGTNDPGVIDNPGKASGGGDKGGGAKGGGKGSDPAQPIQQK